MGGWLRALSFLGDQGTYWVLVLGTFVFFVANPFILNSISIIANMWFADNERARCIAISGLTGPFGSLLGLALTGVISIGIDIDDVAMCTSRLKQIIYGQNIIFTVFVLLFIILFREKPETPPSKTALTFRLLSQTGIKEDIRTLSANRNFLLTATTFVIMWGNFIALGNTLTPIFNDDFTPSEISLIGVAFVIAGVIGCFMMGLFVDKT